jgi:proteic killer suppression protein
VDVEFGDEDLERLERDPDFTAGFSRDVVRSFRKAMGAIRAAVDARDLYNGGLRTEKLKGARSDEHSIRLNKQWRLIAEIDGSKIYVKGIEDYH